MPGRPSALEVCRSVNPEEIMEIQKGIAQRERADRLVAAMKETKYRRRSILIGTSTKKNENEDDTIAGWLTKMRKNHGSSALFATKRYFCLRGTKLLWFDGPNGRMLGEADVGGASIEHPSPNSLKISYHNGRKDQLRVNTNNHGPTAKEWVLALRAVAVSTRIEAFSKSKRSSILTVLDHLSPPLIVNDHQHYKENDDDENRPPSRRVFTVLKRIKAKGKALERLAEIRDGYLYLFDLEERLKKKILLSHLVSVEQSKFVSQQLILRWGDRHKNFRLDFRTIGQAETFFYLLQAQNWNSGQAPGKSYSSRLGYDSSTKKQNGWLRIRICTWNVGNRAPSKNLGPWLRYPGAHVTDQELDDAIDTEESVKEEEEEEELIVHRESEFDDDDYDCDDDDDPGQDEEETPTTEDTSSSRDDANPQHRPRGVRLPPVNFEHATSDVFEDIIVVGCQECSYNMNNEGSSVWNKMVQHAHHHLDNNQQIGSRTVNREDWVHLCCAQFIDQGYDLICEEHFWSLRLLIFIRRDHSRFVSTVEKDHKGCGIGDRLGNKGAVAAALSLYDTTLCFVNCHLEANQNEVQKRNEDFEQIVDGICLGRPELDILSQFDHVFWFGDLNYRVDVIEKQFFSDALACRLPRPARGNDDDFIEHESDIIQKREILQNLRDVDQLDGERKAGRAFWGFQETPVFDFAPTYRFERFSNYTRKPGERRQYTPNRVPSWCDRILWKSLPGIPRVVQTLLACVDDVPDLDTSDHAPLVAAFALRRGIQSSPNSIVLVDTPPQSSGQRNEFIFLDMLSASGAPGLQPFHFRKPQRCALRFFGRFIEPIGTDFTHSAQCLAPRWKASDDIPPILVARTANLRALRYSSIQIQLIDQGENCRVLGTAVLELKECCDLQGRPFPFRVALAARGVPCGELRGTLTARGPIFFTPRSKSSNGNNTPSSALRNSSYLRKSADIDDHTVYRNRSASWASASGADANANEQEKVIEKEQVDLDLPVLMKPPPLRALSEPLSPIPIPESPPRKPNLLVPSKFLHSNSSTPDRNSASASSRWSPGFLYSAINAEDDWSRPSGMSGGDIDLEALFEPNHIPPPIVAVSSSSHLGNSSDSSPACSPRTSSTSNPQQNSPPRPRPPDYEDSVL